MLKNLIHPPRFVLTIALAMLALSAGCTLVEPPATPAVIYVTATAEPVTPSPEAAPALADTPTPVIAPLTAITLSPLPMATSTRTPLPTTPPTLTPSFTPSQTESPVPTGAAGVPGVIAVGGSAPAPGSCSFQPGGGFATLYSRDVALQGLLGCAVGAPIAINAAVQDFENGRMLWASSLGEIPGGVIYAVANAGTFQRAPDTWIEGTDPLTAPGGEGAPPGRVAPIRGFGKVWGLNPAIRAALGWALSAEAGTGAQIQRFERGEMLFVASLGQTFIFIGTGAGAWRLEATAF